MKCSYPLRARNTIHLEKMLRRDCGGKPEQLEGGVLLLKNVAGLCAKFLGIQGKRAFTVGHTIFTASSDLDSDDRDQEMEHVEQYELLGDAFWLAYGGGALLASLGCQFADDYADCAHDYNFMELIVGHD